MGRGLSLPSHHALMLAFQQWLEQNRRPVLLQASYSRKVVERGCLGIWVDIRCPFQHGLLLPLTSTRIMQGTTYHRHVQALCVCVHVCACTASMLVRPLFMQRAWSFAHDGNRWLGMALESPGGPEDIMWRGLASVAVCCTPQPWEAPLQHGHGRTENGCVTH